MVTSPKSWCAPPLFSLMTLRERHEEPWGGTGILCSVHCLWLEKTPAAQHTEPRAWQHGGYPGQLCTLHWVRQNRKPKTLSEVTAFSLIPWESREMQTASDFLSARSDTCAWTWLQREVGTFEPEYGNFEKSCQEQPFPWTQLQACDVFFWQKRCFQYSSNSWH